VRGWRATLAADPRRDGLYRQCETSVRDLCEASGERADVVHGDLLHGNVLVAPDASDVTAVFSWKCSLLGDFVYDVAWCTFWGDTLYPGVAAARVWKRVLVDLEAAGDRKALIDIATRHHCYELHIGARHLGWYAWTGDNDELDKVAMQTEIALERGPLPAS
jgi:aminoglycoside phosphotransferase (APT) family kinase protein